MNPIYCYSHSTPLTLLAVIDDYESFSFQRSYSGIGTWQLVLDADTLNAQRITGINYIAAGARVAGLVKKIDAKNEEGRHLITLTGVELKGLAETRIIMPPTAEAYLDFTGTPEYIIKELLRTQIVEAAAERLITNTSIATYSAINDSVTKSYRFQNLAESIVELASTYYIGWYADIEDGAIVFHIYNGANRTAAQSVNDRLIVSYERDTLNSSNYTKLQLVPATALVAGQGEGVDRELTLVGNDKTGIERSEIYVDARDIEDSALLGDRGAEKLAEYSSGDIYSLTMGQQLIGMYKVTYDLGDIGTVYDTYLPEGTKDFYLTDIEEVYEEDAFTINATFGYDKQTLAHAIQRVTGNSSNLAYVEGTSVDVDAIIAAAVSQAVTQAVADAKLASHPVGSLYWSEESTNPNTLFGGTWQQIKDKFILAAGDTYNAGDSGGDTAHAHSVGGYAALTVATNSPNIAVRRITTDSWTSNMKFVATANGSSNTGANTTGIEVGGVTSNVNHMPPYEVFYCWKRIS